MSLRVKGRRLPTTANCCADTLIGRRRRFDLALNHVVVPAASGPLHALPRDGRPLIFHLVIIRIDGDFVLPKLFSEEVQVRGLDPAHLFDASCHHVRPDLLADQSVEDHRVAACAIANVLRFRPHGKVQDPLRGRRILRLLPGRLLPERVGLEALEFVRLALELEHHG